MPMSHISSGITSLLSGGLPVAVLLERSAGCHSHVLHHVSSSLDMEHSVTAVTFQHWRDATEPPPGPDVPNRRVPTGAVWALLPFRSLVFRSLAAMCLCRESSDFSSLEFVWLLESVDLSLPSLGNLQPLFLQVHFQHGPFSSPSGPPTLAPDFCPTDTGRAGTGLGPTLGLRWSCWSWDSK